MRNCSSQYTEVIYQICHGLRTVLVLISKAGGKSFTPNLEQLKTSKDYLKWSIENEIHNHQAWFENLNQTSPWPLPVAIIAANEQFVCGAGWGMVQGKLYRVEALERGGAAWLTKIQSCSKFKSTLAFVCMQHNRDAWYKGRTLSFSQGHKSNFISTAGALVVVTV